MSDIDKLRIAFDDLVKCSQNKQLKPAGLLDFIIQMTEAQNKENETSESRGDPEYKALSKSADGLRDYIDEHFKEKSVKPIEVATAAIRSIVLYFYSIASSAEIKQYGLDININPLLPLQIYWFLKEINDDKIKKPNNSQDILEETILLNLKMFDYSQKLKFQPFELVYAFSKLTEKLKKYKGFSVEEFKHIITQMVYFSVMEMAITLEKMKDVK